MSRSPGPASRWLTAGVAGAAAWLAMARSVLAESPTPSTGLGDPRGGESASIAGNPGLAIAIVVLIAVVALVATLAWVRATGGPSDAAEDR